MIKAVFDSNLLVSAFLTRSSGGVSTELLRFVINGTIEPNLSIAVADEVAETLMENERARSCSTEPIFWFWLRSWQTLRRYRARFRAIPTTTISSRAQ